jgi:broad specificity polyphosphatase/5'/3'-nucleotidase SurE
VLYSGTVAAAMEATILGVPAVALSYMGADAENLAGWEYVIHGLLEQLLKRADFRPKRCST